MIICSGKALYQLENAHLLAVETVSVLEVVTVEPVDTDNQRKIYQSMMI